MSETVRAAHLPRTLGLAGAGALFVLLGDLVRGPTPGAASVRPMPVVAWACDRDAGRVLGLDADLRLVLDVALAAPLALVARADGGAWVLCAVPGELGHAMRLVRLGPAGDLRAEAAVGAVVDLAVLRGEDALVVERADARPGRDRLMRVDGTGRRTVLLERVGLLCARDLGAPAGPRRIGVGTADGRVLALDAKHPERPPLVGWPGGRIADLAPAPDGGTWFLDAGDGSRGARVGRLARRRRAASVLGTTWWRGARGARRLLPTAGGAAVWLVGAGTRRAALQPGSGKRPAVVAELALATSAGAAVVPEPPEHEHACGPELLDPPEIPLPPELDGSTGRLAAGAAWSDGGAVVVVPGALLRLDRDGRPAPGQGGFRALTDVDRVPP